MRTTATVLPARSARLIAITLAALLSMATFLIATRAAGAQTPTPSATASPTPQRRLEPAPIEAVEVQMLKTNPVQVQVLVTSGLPGGCAAFDSIRAKRTGAQIDVAVQNSMPVGNVPCTAIYGYAKNTVSLGSDFTPGMTYTVVVNGGTQTTKTVTFVGQAASPLPEPSATPPSGTPSGTPTPLVPRPANVGSAGLAGAPEAAGPAIMVAIAALAAGVVGARIPRRP